MKKIALLCLFALQIMFVYAQPTIQVTPDTLNFGNIQVGTTSTPQFYSISGTNLTDNITVAAPTGYKVSTSISGTYTNSITLSQNGGVVMDTVFVKFSPTLEQIYNVNITNVSSGATTQNIAVTGKGIKPTIVVTPTSLSFGNVYTDSISMPKSYIVSGTNLTANITVTAPTGYKISKDSAGTYTNSIVLPQTGGIVSDTIFVKFMPIAFQTYNSNIYNVSTGATTKTVAVSGIGIKSTIYISQTNIAFSNVQAGTTSAPQTYTVSGKYLFSDITISATAGLTISTTSGGAYTNTLTLAQTGDSVSATTIYVKYSPNSTQSYN